MPTAVRGAEPTNCVPQLGGRAIQRNVAIPPRPMAAAPILASFVGDDSWHAGMIRVESTDGPGAGGTNVRAGREPPHALRYTAHAAAGDAIARTCSLVAADEPAVARRGLLELAIDAWRRRAR